MILPVRRLACVAILLFAALASAQVPAPAPKPQAAKSGVETKFDLGVSSVFVDVDGSRDKFRTERNLRSGFNTGNLRLEFRPAEGATSFFNSAVLTAFGLGDSSPYQRAAFRVRKTKLYDFDAGYRKFNLFFALPDFALGFHPEDSVGRALRFGLKLLPDRTVSFRATYRRNQLYGTRFMSQSLIFDAYQVFYPRRLSSDEFGGGFQLRTRVASFSVDQHFRRFRDDQQLFATGATGVNRSVLDSGQRDALARISSPMTTLLGRFQPGRRYDLVARYLYSAADLDLTRYEDLLNRLAGQVPVRQIISGAGASDKPTHNVGLGQTFDITDRLAFHHRAFYHTYTITGFINSAGIIRITDPSGSERESPFASMGGSFTRYAWAFNEAELTYDLARSLTLLSRYSYGDRHMTFGHLETTNRRVVTISHAGAAGFSWIPGEKARFNAEFEKGAASQAFNRIDPLDFVRWKLRAQFRPLPRLTLNANALFEDNSTDIPDVNRDLDNRQFGLQAVRLIGRQTVLSGGYNYLRIHSSTDIVFYFLNELTQGISVYESDAHLAHVLLQLPLHSRFEIRAGYNFLKDTGATYPLRMHLPRAGFTVWLAKSVGVEADWQHYSYNERLRSVLDYRANTLAVGLRLRN